MIRLKDDEMAERLVTDAFYALEHKTIDARKGAESVPVLTRLQRLNDAQWSDPYTNSQRLRKRFREEKHASREVHLRAEDIRNRGSLHIDLLPESAEDELAAKIVEFSDPSQTAQDKRILEAITSPIFTSKKMKPSPISASAGDTTKSSAFLELGSKVVINTKMRTDPFLVENGLGWPGAKGFGVAEDGLLEGIVKIKRKRMEDVDTRNVKEGEEEKKQAKSPSILGVNYSSSEED